MAQSRWHFPCPPGPYHRPHHCGDPSPPLSLRGSMPPGVGASGRVPAPAAPAHAPAGCPRQPALTMAPIPRPLSWPAPLCPFCCPPPLPHNTRNWAPLPHNTGNVLLPVLPHNTGNSQISTSLLPLPSVYPRCPQLPTQAARSCRQGSRPWSRRGSRRISQHGTDQSLSSLSPSLPLPLPLPLSLSLSLSLSLIILTKIGKLTYIL